MLTLLLIVNFLSGSVCDVLVPGRFQYGGGQGLTDELDQRVDESSEQINGSGTRRCRFLAFQASLEPLEARVTAIGQPWVPRPHQMDVAGVQRVEAATPDNGDQLDSEPVP